MVTPRHTRHVEIEHAYRVDPMCVFGSRVGGSVAPVERRDIVELGL